jgi:hypothetical protein
VYLVTDVAHHVRADSTRQKGMSSELSVTVKNSVPASDLSIGGAAPYWRVAFEYNIGEHSFEVGTFGLSANLLPGRVPGFGFDQILDIGFDAQYQYIGDPHIITAKITHINEQQHLKSSFLQGLTSNNYNTLESFKTSLGYIYGRTARGSYSMLPTCRSATAGLRSGLGPMPVSAYPTRII